MTKSKLLAMMFLLAGAFFINSCSDDDDDNNPIDTPTPSEKFFTAAEGNSWTYERFDNTKADGVSATPMAEYTITISGMETKLEKEAYIYTNDYGGTAKSQHYIPDGQILEGLVENVIPNTIPFELPVDEAWVTIADLSKSEWLVYTKKLDNVDMSFESITAQVTGELNILGEVKMDEYDVEVGGTTYATRRIDLTYQIKISSAKIMGNDVNEEGTIELVGSFYYAEGKGLLKTVFEPQTISYTVVSQVVEGFVDKCKSFDVK